MSPVEIVIPFHGEENRVARLVQGIFGTISTNRYLVTLVDDHSDNKEFSKEMSDAKIPGLRLIRHDKHKGFGAAVNTALSRPFKTKQLPKGIPWVAVVQSDVEVFESDWLSCLGESMFKLKEGGVKMISPRTNNPVVDLPSAVGQRGVRGNDLVLAEGYLPMYCVFFHRELFFKVGPLKEFPYAGLEAEDYARRMGMMGYKQALCGSSWVHHEGGCTLANFSNSRKAQEILRKSREEFYGPIKKEESVGTYDVSISKEDVS